MFNHPIKDNTSINEEIDREFAEAQKKLDAMMNKINNYSANASYYSIDDLWNSDKLIGRGWLSTDFNN